MAVKIIASRNEGMKDGKNYLRAELVADSVSDLTVEGISNYHFTFGSIAWVVGSAEWYGLDSSENWVKQGNSDSSAEVESTQQSNSAAPNNAPLSLNSGLNRPATLDEPKSATISTESEKADTSDSEGVSDNVKEESGETEKQTENIPEEVTEDEPESEEIVEEEIIDDEPTLEEALKEIEEESAIDDISEEQEEGE